jgi:hypothetical protein
MSDRTTVLLILSASLALPFQAAAGPIASAFTIVSVPQVCGSVCVPAVSVSTTGGISGGILSAIASLDPVEFSEARINLATGQAGVAVANDIGHSRANADHSDTWFCGNAAQCAVLAVPGSFVPVTINLHVSGSASLTPPGGFMSITYTYDAFSLLGSSSLGLFQFSFTEDPGRGLNPHIDGTATFVDAHTGVSHDLNVEMVSQGFNTGLIAFGADLSVTSFIGGCAAVNCDLTHGIFTDTQGLSAQLDAANDGSAQILSSLNTFAMSFTSDLPFVSADGRTAGAAAAAAAPEPGTAMLVLVASIVGLGGTRRRRSHLLSHEAGLPQRAVPAQADAGPRICAPGALADILDNRM